ncbi:MAG TPA: cytochrome d ubiquinol oxidase subunit II [Longimicrobiales bacterium]|nr:cytochrome d ubiquinol oxidase subunit II [Longimicrobiales bacterium]
MTLELALAGTVLACLVIYALLGGADFGGGVWDLLATGPRAAEQRETISGAIGPIWEANHVWMIVAVVLLFTAFPPAFAAIMTALHIPITLMLVGIVLRGSSFVFRKMDPRGEGVRSTWQRVFAVSSIVTPVMLGVVLGTISTPAIGYEDGVVTGGFVDPWLAPFPWMVGIFALALFAFLAAVYLTMETRNPELQDDFRIRALWSALPVALAGLAVLLMAPAAAPEVAKHLGGSAVGIALVVAGGVSLAGAVAALAARRYVSARVLAGGVVVLVLLGWGFGMDPWLLAGALTIRESAAPPVTLRLVLGILGAGTVVLVPAFGYLYLTFKRQVLFPDVDG